MIFFLFHIQIEGKCGWIIGGEGAKSMLDPPRKLFGAPPPPPLFMLDIPCKLRLFLRPPPHNPPTFSLVSWIPLANYWWACHPPTPSSSYAPPPPSSYAYVHKETHRKLQLSLFVNIVGKHNHTSFIKFKLIVV